MRCGTGTCGRTIRARAVVVAVISWLCLSALAVSVRPGPVSATPETYVEGTDPAAALFDPERVLRVDIDLTEEVITRLNSPEYLSESRPYVPAVLMLETPCRHGRPTGRRAEAQGQRHLP